MNYRTVLSIMANIMLGQGFVLAWWLILFTNTLWILYHVKRKNYELAQLHTFYAVNSLVAICR